jgi:hypothetical protein
MSSTRAAGGEEERYEPPGNAVVEVVDQARLRAGAQPGLAVAGARERAAQRGLPTVRLGVPSLLEGDVAGGVANEQHRDE